LERFDQAKNEEERLIEKAKIVQLETEFYDLRNKVEKTYAKTRIIHKPKDYILDQDHHHHLANQLKAFDWQFYAELLLFEKLNTLNWHREKIN